MEKIIVTKELISTRIQQDSLSKKRVSKGLIMLLQLYYDTQFLDAPLQILFTQIITEFPEIELSENKLRLIRYRMELKKVKENFTSNDKLVQHNSEEKTVGSEGQEELENQKIIEQIFSKIKI